MLACVCGAALAHAPPRPPRRRHILGAAAAASLAPPPAAVAWCGGTFPGKNPSEPEELLVPFERGTYRTELFVRRIAPSRFVRDQRNYVSGLPAVLLVGCPAVGYDCVPRRAQTRERA
eukprot:6066904-Prymnesium_polylepis.2